MSATRTRKTKCFYPRIDDALHARIVNVLPLLIGHKPRQDRKHRPVSFTDFATAAIEMLCEALEEGVPVVNLPTLREKGTTQAVPNQDKQYVSKVFTDGLYGVFSERPQAYKRAEHGDVFNFDARHVTKGAEMRLRGTVFTCDPNLKGKIGAECIVRDRKTHKMAEIEFTATGTEHTVHVYDLVPAHQVELKEGDNGAD